MTLRKRIVNALQSLKLPIEENFYGGESKEWFTWNLADEKGTDFESGEAHAEFSSVQIHLFLLASTKYETMKKTIKKNLIEQGFTHPDVQILFEDDTKLRHIIFSCDIATEREE